MKSREAVICAVLVMVLLFGVYHEFGGAAGGDGKLLPARIAIVSIQKILTEGAKAKAWDSKMQVEGERMRSELEKLRDEIIAEEAILKTRNPESGDYDRLSRELMEKAITLKAKDNFFQQDIMVRQERWTENAFKQVLAVAEKVAKDKGVDIVLAKEDYQWPARSANELAIIMRTSKVLYSAVELDITDAVLSAWNAEK
jgi:Skp family chaperone for outer membrane proteins